MCSSFCSCLPSCSLSCGLVPFAGPIMALPRRQQPSAPQSTAFSSRVPHTIAPSVASPPPSRQLWSLRFSLCALGARSKAGGSLKADKYRGLRLPSPHVSVLRDHRCVHPRASLGRHAWPGFAHSDVSRPCLPHDVHGSARHPLAPSENPSRARSQSC
jgi:hypothetical protein